MRLRPNNEQKIKFHIKDLVTFTKEILHGKRHFLCSAINQFHATSLFLYSLNTFPLF